jgi:photosystem II stability/assembly factor-like uncharacterized protein
MKRTIKITAAISVSIFILISTVGCNGNENSKMGDKSDSAQAVASPTIASSKHINNDTKNESVWKEISSNTVDVGFVQAGFIDENIGVTVGLDGEVHYTNDGGKNWPYASNNSACRYVLDFANNNTVWHCGNNGDVGISEDGGKIWECQVGAFKDKGRYISALDSKTAWIGTRMQLSVTTDGAKSFKDMGLPKDITSIAAICARSEKEGYILNYDGFLFHTKDGGQNWSSYKIEDGGKPVQVYFNSLPTLSAQLRFFDDNNGVVAYCSEDKGIWIMRTSDGGKTWAKEKATDNFANNIYMSPDGKYITFDDSQNKITLLKYEK